MEGNRFDLMVKTLSAAATRRGVLAFLSTLPLLGGLAALLGEAETEAAGRRKRRKKRHKHGKGRHKGKRKKTTCKPNSTAKTCAGKCGIVKNNCRKTVDCGSCECEPACPVCQICDATTGACVSDQQGEACGQSGQVCQDGDCACDDASCAACQTCQGDGFCSSPCDGSGCCDGEESCQPGDVNDACGTDGDTCLACSTPTPLCVDGACAACMTGPQCAEAGLGDLCCSGSCVDGNCCDSAGCSNPTPICVNNVCTALAGIALTKSSDAGAVISVEDFITYTFLVENTGQIDLVDVVVIDTLPGLSAIACPAVTSLAAGASFACTATYVVTQADVDAGEVVNAAAVTGVATDGVVVTDADSLVIP